MSGTTPSSDATAEYTPEGRPRSFRDTLGLAASPVPMEQPSSDPAVFSQRTNKGSFGPLGARSPGAPGGGRERRLSSGPAGYLSPGVKPPTAERDSAAASSASLPLLVPDFSKPSMNDAESFTSLGAMQAETQTLHALLASSQAHAGLLSFELADAVQQGARRQSELSLVCSELSNVRREYDDAASNSNFQI